MADISQRGWALHAASSTRGDSWVAAAQRLRDVLDAISKRVAVAYGRPVSWISQGMDAAGWADAERIAADMERLINTDERGVVWHELGSSGVVTGYLDGRDLVNVRWKARHADTPLQCTAEFWTPAEEGVARPLVEHDPDWLADLLLDTAAAMVDARAARITTSAWTRVLREHKIKCCRSVGAISYSPHPVDPGALPPTMRVARETPAGTAIVVKDLRRFASDPASLLDDLLALERQITSAQATT